MLVWPLLASRDGAFSLPGLECVDPQMIKDQMDKKFGAPWHVVVGRGFSYEITYEVRRAAGAGRGQSVGAFPIVGSGTLTPAGCRQSVGRLHARGHGRQYLTPRPYQAPTLTCWHASPVCR